MNRGHLRNNSLGIFFGLLFLMALAGQSLAGFHEYNETEAAQAKLTREAPQTISYPAYLASPEFSRDVMENWQSEFLAVGTMAVFAIYLRQRGSPESKPVGSAHHRTDVEG